MSKSIRYPKCRSTNVQVLGNNRKGFSVGKAVRGRLLGAFTPIGSVGLFADFIGKKGKYEVFCGDCGHRWKVKWQGVMNHTVLRTVTGYPRIHRKPFA